MHLQCAICILLRILKKRYRSINYLVVLKRVYVKVEDKYIKTVPPTIHIPSMHVVYVQIQNVGVTM
jgi:hypothetical protein